MRYYNRDSSFVITFRGKTYMNFFVENFTYYVFGHVGFSRTFRRFRVMSFGTKSPHYDENFKPPYLVKNRLYRKNLHELSSRKTPALQLCPHAFSPHLP